MHGGSPAQPKQDPFRSSEPLKELRPEKAPTAFSILFLRFRIFSRAGTSGRIVFVDFELVSRKLKPVFPPFRRSSQVDGVHVVFAAPSDRILENFETIRGKKVFLFPEISIRNNFHGIFTLACPWTKGGKNNKEVKKHTC